jgi:hypothetical protein
MRDWFKRTESLLYRYPIYRARLEQIEDELSRLEPRFIGKQLVQYDKGEIQDKNKIDPALIPAAQDNTGEPERLAVARAGLTQERDRLLAKIRAIERVKEVLTEQERELFEIKYIRGMDFLACQEELNVSRRGVYLIRRSVVEKAAKVQGFLDCG